MYAIVFFAIFLINIQYLSRYRTGCHANMGNDSGDSGKILDVDGADIFVIKMDNRLHYLS